MSVDCWRWQGKEEGCPSLALEQMERAAIPKRESLHSGSEPPFGGHLSFFLQPVEGADGALNHPA